MTQTLTEAARSIPVLDEVDVLVVGGGVSGCAAAWAAAQAGARTMLVERNGCLGGVATATLMANIGNRFLTASAEQVIQGFAGLLIDRLVAAGAASSGWRAREVPGCVIDSERLKVELIDVLEEAGVHVLTHALGARPVLEGNCVRGVFLESKSGRQAILAGVTIDCTGEADIAWQAGAEVSFSTGTASTLFKLANVDLDAFVEFLGTDPDGFPDHMDMTRDLEVFTRNWQERGILFFPHGGGRNWRFLQPLIDSGDYPTEEGPAQNLQALGMYALQGTGFVVINSNFYRIEDLDVRNLSRFELHAQKMCYRVADLLRDHVPGFCRACVAHIGVDLGVRVSRTVKGSAELDMRSADGEPVAHRFDDVIGTTPVADPAWSNGLPFGNRTCDVPLGLVLPVGCEGLLVASGKCVGTQPRGALRGMSGCMVFGHAAGVTGALAARQGVTPRGVPVRDVQRELLRQGARLGDRQRLTDLGLG